MKQKMADLHEKMQNQQRQNSSASTSASSTTAKPQTKSVAGDYIDYEEIKEIK